MSLVFINAGLIAVTAVVLAVLTFLIHAWRRRKVRTYLEETQPGRHGLVRWMKDIMLDNYFLVDDDFGASVRAVETIKGYLRDDRMRYERYARLIGRVALALNILTTLIALIPVGLAVYNLIANNQHQALNFNLAALATLLVTKGGLFLLTLVVVPLLKAVPVGAGTTVGGLIAQTVWKRTRGRNKSNRAD